MSAQVSAELSWLHDAQREQGYDSGRATPDRVIVVAAFAVVLLSVTWVRTAVALRVDGVVHVLDVLGGLLGPVVRMDKNTMDGGGVWTWRKNGGRVFIDTSTPATNACRRECVAEATIRGGSSSEYVEKQERSGIVSGKVGTRATKEGDTHM